MSGRDLGIQRERLNEDSAYALAVRKFPGRSNITSAIALCDALLARRPYPHVLPDERNEMSGEELLDKLQLEQAPAAAPLQPQPQPDPIQQPDPNEIPITNDQDAERVMREHHIGEQYKALKPMLVRRGYATKDELNGPPAVLLANLRADGYGQRLTPKGDEQEPINWDDTLEDMRSYRLWFRLLAALGGALAIAVVTAIGFGLTPALIIGALLALMFCLGAAAPEVSRVVKQ